MNEKKEFSKIKKKDKTNSRRHFLKKAVYATPTLMALGHLARPTNATADSIDAINNDTRLSHPHDFF